MTKQKTIIAINKYKKEHTKKAYYQNQKKLAYEVPGTKEYIEVEALKSQLHRIK